VITEVWHQKAEKEYDPVKHKFNFCRRNNGEEKRKVGETDDYVAIHRGNAVYVETDVNIRSSSLWARCSSCGF
jgi:hypothetical protein